MTAVLKKSKGQCTTLEKMMQFCVKIIAVASCIVELGQLKKEERRNKKTRKKKKKKEGKVGIQPVQVCHFGKLGVANVHRNFAP